MTDDEAWRAEAARQAIDASTMLLIEWLYQMHFDTRPEGGQAAFDHFRDQLNSLLSAKEPIDVPSDRTQALVSDLSRDILSEFLNRLAARI